MDLFSTISIYIFILLLLIFSGMPIAFALGILAIGSVYFGYNPKMLPALGYVTWVSLANSVVGAIPLFILMGNILFESGLSSKIYSGISPLLDRLLPGGILHSNIVAGAAFAACCGSSIATCATIGSVSLSEMEKRGYARGIAAGSVAAGGTLGILIPPSITLIVYGAITDTSIGKLFVGGVIPGIILTVFYMIYIGVRIKIHPHLVERDQDVQKLPWKDCLRGILNIWPVLLLVLGVMGSIYAGLATATEAAAIGCGLTLVVAGVFRLLNWDVIKRSVSSGVKTTSMIMVIFLSASLMGVYLGNTGITREVASAVVDLHLSSLATFFCIFMLYFVLGMLMDSLAAIVITLPITFPIIMALGYDPIWYGVILTMFAEVGLLTPPVGMNLFVIQGLRPEYSFKEIVMGCTPFYIVIIVEIMILTAFPKIITFLPKLALG